MFAAPGTQNCPSLRFQEHRGLFVVFLALDVSVKHVEHYAGATVMKLIDEQKIVVEDGRAIALGERGIQFYAIGRDGEPFAFKNQDVIKVTNGRGGLLWSYERDGDR